MSATSRVPARTLRCSGGIFAAGGEGAAAIRQHAVRLWAQKPDATENVVPGTVVAAGFSRSDRDYSGGGG